MIYAKKVTLYEWPASQNCMDCKHGEGITSLNDIFTSPYLCTVACSRNNGVTCSEKRIFLLKEKPDPLADVPSAPPFPV